MMRCSSKRSVSRMLMVAGFIAATSWTSGAYANDICENTTPIYEIQGAGHRSPLVGQTVETCGVVTAVGFNSYYIQDVNGDGKDATSDGLFIFDTRTPPQVGELLRLRDRVDEFIPGGASTGNLSITQFAFPTIVARGTAKLPEPVIIGRKGRVAPNRIVISPSETDPAINLQNDVDAAQNNFNEEVDGIDFYESLEGMLVKIQKPVAVSAIRQFGTFSAEVFVLANRGRDVFPKDARTNRGGINLQPNKNNTGDQNPERIQIQFDATFFGSRDYPAIKVGDRLGDVTGVVGYSFGNFEVNALGAFDIKPSGIKETVAKKRNSKRLTVASYNVLNLSAVSRDDAQREKVAGQIVNNMNSPDIIALQEIQDNNGDASDCSSSNPAPCSNELKADLTLQKLVDRISAAGGPTYSFFTVDPLVETTDDNRDNVDTFGGISLGNIRNAFLYNPERVDLVSFTGLTRDVLASRNVTASTAFDTSRDPLEAVFDFNGEVVTVINNHFSSRFGSSPIFGAIQPFIQAGEGAREAQSQAMNEVTRYHLAQDENANVIVLGDLNTFEFTNDLDIILPGKDEILQNLIWKNKGDNKYSFIFEGNSQALDHIFATRNLAKKATLDFVHVNVDFPRLFSSVVGSDHEPLVATFKFNKNLKVSAK